MIMDELETNWIEFQREKANDGGTELKSMLIWLCFSSRQEQPTTKKQDAVRRSFPW